MQGKESAARDAGPGVAAEFTFWFLCGPFSHLKDPRARLNGQQGWVRAAARAELL